MFVHFAGQRQGQLPMFAGTLYAATGPTMPGTFSCWPPVASWVVWVLDRSTGVQVSCCSAADGMAGASRRFVVRS
ncbi:hypothetical protein ACLBR5_00630 [Escherichia coli]